MIKFEKTGKFDISAGVLVFIGDDGKAEEVSIDSPLVQLFVSSRIALTIDEIEE